MRDEKFTEYVRKYSAAVYRAAYSCTGSRPDSEDIMQETFLRLYQSGKLFRDDEHVKAWLIRVAINRARDILRSNKRKQAEGSQLDENTAADSAAFTDDLDEAMKALPEEYRIAVYLQYYEGYGVKDIARIMRISEANAKIRLKRARDRLRAFLTDE